MEVGLHYMIQFSVFSLHLENPVVLLKTEDLKLKNESYKAKIPSPIDDRIFALEG